MAGVEGGEDFSEDQLELVTKFNNFLRNPDGEYLENIEQMVESGVNEKETNFRLLVDISDLRNYDSDLSASALQRPRTHILAFQEALKQTAVAEHALAYLSRDDVKFHIGFTGSFGSHHLSPRSLLASFLSKMVCVEGIVTKMGNVRPKMEKTVHYCPKTNETMSREYRDATSLDGFPTPAIIPKQDKDGNPYEMEFGLCHFKDNQIVTIQEMPERAPLGQLPRSVDIVLTNDLVDRCKPGDRIQVSGIFRALAGAAANGRSTSFRVILIANSVQTIGKDVQGLVMTPRDLQNIRAIAKTPDVFKILSRSMAPSIYGHKYIKRALLLLLLGGMECNLENGTHLRGDVNILMVGDPSTAKSQLLRFVLGIAPLAVSTTGRGSTGVGLTAAVTSDKDTNEKRLEAGAMVLADRGVVCIDEFDKMGDADRVAIHEVMEQQTVTIAKAGIHASLNARCSVVAAANPIYGQYDRTLTPQRNVGLPDSLLSRFDLLFIVLDNLSPEHDRAISDHVLRMHRYQRPGQEGQPVSLSNGAGIGGVMDDDDEEREDMTAEVYQKFNPLLHGGYAAANGKKDELLSTEFIRKFTHYAKSRIKPVMTQEAQDYICNEYAKLRSEQEQKTLPVTARQLETMIRLSTAHAKVRLSSKVEVEDCENAINIMRFALYHDTKHDAAGGRTGGQDLDVRKGKSMDSEDEDSTDDSEDDDDMSAEKENTVKKNNSKKTKQSKAKSAKTKKKSKPKSREEFLLESSDSESSSDDSDNYESTNGIDENSENVNSQNRKKRPRSSSAGILSPAIPKKTKSRKVDESSPRFKFFQTVLTDLFRKRRVESLKVEEVIKAANDGLKEKGETDDYFTQKEAEEICNILDKNNRVMFTEGEIYSI